MPLDNLGADYDVDDLLPAIRGGLSVDGKLYAAPFYGESSMVMYRKDLIEKAGPDDARRADLGLIADAAAQDDRQGQRQSTASACAARPAGARTWRS